LLFLFLLLPFVLHLLLQVDGRESLGFRYRDVIQLLQTWDLEQQ
jgi:hypothetical protein